MESAEDCIWADMHHNSGAYLDCTQLKCRISSKKEIQRDSIVIDAKVLCF